MVPRDLNSNDPCIVGARDIVIQDARFANAQISLDHDPQPISYYEPIQERVVMSPIVQIPRVEKTSDG
jgi:hypothetical protein